MKKKLIITTAVLAIIAVIGAAIYFMFKTKIEKARENGDPKPISPTTSDKIIEQLFPRKQNNVIQSNNAWNSFNIEKISSVNQVPVGLPFPTFKDWKEEYSSAPEFIHNSVKWRVDTRSVGVHCIVATCPTMDTYYLIYLG